MPRIYFTGDKIPSIDTEVIGGTTLVIHHPDDVQPILEFIESAAQPPNSPLASVYHTLSDPRLIIDDWLAHFRALMPFRVDQTATSNETDKPPPQISSELSGEGEVEEPTLLRSDLKALLEAIRIAVDVWRSAPQDEQEQIVLVVAIADPTKPRNTPVLVDGNGAAFAITRGSLIAQVAKLPLRASVFFVGLLTGEGATPAARVEGLVERIRRQAIAEAGFAAKNLPRIDDAKFAPDPNKPLVVLVHGLFDTDVGLFRELENLLRQDFALAGFPHDTLLSGIESNALDLARILQNLNPRNGVRLVCHSRGGLVARRAVQFLHDIQSEIIKACVTFGTPHNGSPLAESPSLLIAAVAIAKMTVGTRSGATLLDLMSAATMHGNLPGIADLRPPLAGDTFIKELQRSEGLFFDAKVPFMVVGGRWRPSRISEWVASRALGRNPNDLVVPIASSMPRMARRKGQEVVSNHYRYFDPAHAKVHTAVINFLKKPLA